MPISGTYATNSAITFKDALVEVDLDGTGTWASLAGWATDVRIEGEDVPTDSTYPFQSDPITFAGVQGPARVTVMTVYTEASTEPFWNVRSRFEAAPGGNFNVRFTPKGSTAGNLRYTTTGGKLTRCSPPGGAGDGRSATLFTFVCEADSLGMARI
jgi:hypothetical protein